MPRLCRARPGGRGLTPATLPKGPPAVNTEDELRAVLAEAAADAGAELLNQATNMFGALRPEARARLLRLIANPSPDTWDDAYSIILNANVGLGRTLWQAMIAVDPNCPRRGQPEGKGERITPDERWQGYAPDPLTVLLAIRNAVQS